MANLSQFSSPQLYSHICCICIAMRSQLTVTLCQTGVLIRQWFYTVWCGVWFTLHSNSLAGNLRIYCFFPVYTVIFAVFTVLLAHIWSLASPKLMASTLNRWPSLQRQLTRQWTAGSLQCKPCTVGLCSHECQSNLFTSSLSTVHFHRNTLPLSREHTSSQTRQQLELFDCTSC